MVKVRTSKIDEKQPAAPAKRTLKRRYNPQRNADDGVDYDEDNVDEGSVMGMEEFLTELIGKSKNKRLNAVFIELGDTLIPYYIVQTIEKVTMFDEDEERMMYGIAINKDIGVGVEGGKSVAEWWYDADTRDRAYLSLRQQLADAGLTIIRPQK